MHFIPQAVPAELPAIFARAVAVCGWPAWKARMDELASQVRQNPQIRDLVIERFGLELAFDEVKVHLRNTGRPIWPPQTAEQYRLYSFLSMLARVHQRLGEKGKHTLSGSMQSALSGDSGLGPIALEMRVAADLMHKGFDVSFADLEKGGGGHDFLATRDGSAIEVECKHISGDVGRKVPRHVLFKLMGTLAPILKAVTANPDQGVFVEVLLTDRLESSLEQHRAIRDAISAALAENRLIENQGCRANVERFHPREIPALRQVERLDRAQLENSVGTFAYERFKAETKNVIAFWSPKSGVALISIKSDKPDGVLMRIFRRLREDAAQQFTGELPAMLFVHFADLSQEDLVMLATEERRGRITGLRHMASHLLERRPHVHTIVFMTDGDVEVAQYRDSEVVRTSTQESGKTYAFANPEHPAARQVSILTQR